MNSRIEAAEIKFLMALLRCRNTVRTRNKAITEELNIFNILEEMGIGIAQSV
jgi:hypothetical protein